MSHQLFTIKDLSSFLNLHPNTIYKWKDQGKIPCVDINGQVRFRKRELEYWLDNRSFNRAQIESLFPKLDVPLEAYDRMLLKGDSAVSKKKQRWNYGDYGVFIRKTQSGVKSWYGWHYEEVNGKRRRIRKVIPRAMCREEAVLVARKRAGEAFKREHGLKNRKKDIGFCSFSKIYLEDYIMNSRRKWESDGYRLKKLTEFFKDVELGQITRSLVEKFRDSRRKAGNSESTVNRYLALLKRMFNLAIEEGYLEQNPMRGIRLHSERDTIKDRILTEAEESRLLSESSDRLRPVVKIALHTGMRLGEILGLRWVNVNFSKRKIKVEKTKSRKARFIPVNSTLFDELTRLEKEAGRDGRVFPFKSVRTAFENACRRAGVKNLTFHDLRRTFGTRLLEKGVDIVTIQKLYGHSGVSVTQRYLHPDDEVSRDAVELLSEKTAEEPRNGEILTRIWPAKKDKSPESLPTTLFSMN
jgi:excisionase family DNA binding protein